MTKIPLTNTQYYALQGIVFILCFVGTICFVVALAALCSP
jgi:hypothetical protein